MSIKTYDQADVTKKQHKQPCSDCPWRRNSVPGWLGENTPEQWLLDVQGEAEVLCHTKKAALNCNTHWQCAGAAIYRGNTHKLPRSRSLLVLPSDKILVFANSDEFLTHHHGDMRGDDRRTAVGSTPCRRTRATPR